MALSEHDRGGRPSVASCRAATAADVARICEICATAYRATYHDLLPAGYIERAIRDFYAPDRVRREITPDPPGWLGYQVVEDARRVQGAAGGGLTSPTAGELFVIYLDPAERNRGLGTLLLNRVIDQLRTAGATEIWASVNENNDRGLPFYRARGFEVADRQPAYWSRPEENLWSLRLRKPLPTTR